MPIKGDYSKHDFVKTVCSTCYCSCGVLAQVKDGRVVRIEGDPDHPWSKGALCPKGLSGIELLYHPDRLNYPMKRIGKRGEGKWQRISWNEALDTISFRLDEIKEKSGPEAICMATGAGLYANYGIMGYVAYLLGTPNMMTSGYICFNPAGTAAWSTIGYSAALFAQEMVNEEIFDSKCILLWASNPKNTHPYPVGEGILKQKEKGVKLLVVDPRPTEYAKKADLWLKIRPATDDALALGMLHVIINEGLYDKKFVDDWTFGFEELKAHVQDYPPGKMSGITWVPEKDIVAAARMFAGARPSCIIQRVPIDQNCNAVQTSRAIFILNAICGNLDKKGGNLLPRTGNILTENAVRAQLEKLPREVLEKRIGAKEIPILSGPDGSGGMVHPTLWARAMLTGKPYPIRAQLTSANNQILRDQESKTVVKALMKLEFSASMELFMTPTAELSDIVLPATSWLERDGLRGHPGYPYLIPVQHRAIDPLYERWDDNQFFIELAKRMELPIPWQSSEEYIDFRLEGSGVTFAELDGINFLSLPKEYERHLKGQIEFKTPSKKVELYSAILKRFGYDPLPHPMAPPETTPEFPLILMGGKKSLEYVHTTGRQIKLLRQRYPDPALEIEPDLAAEMNIREGDWVWVETIYFDRRERIRFRAKPFKGIPRQVVAVEHGWWFPEKEDPLHGAFDSNVNVVTPNDVYDPILGSTNLRSIPCRIYKE
jgi:anaerobic selenocysteine-containing dehydrogenase